MVRYDKSSAQRGSRYVEDRRDGSRGGALGRRSGARRGGVAVGGIGGLILLVLGAIFGLGLGSGGDGTGFGIDAGFPEGGTGQIESGGGEVVDPDADTKEFMEFLMFDIQDTWDGYFDQAGLTYQTTSLVIFDDVVDTGCGRATSAVGPFYCPAPDDRKVYVDFAFYNELSRRFGAPGDFAQAYVIAHEVGHHIQSITGISDQVRQAQAQDPANKNEYSVRQELQADCLAGVWAYSANRRLTAESGQAIIEAGDIEEGLAAAAAVGDDRIQAQAGMSVDPHTWTHGSSEQRMRWFTRGFDTGDPEQCDPFSVSDP